MARGAPLRKHMELAFTSFLPTSPMRTCMVDYAFYTAKITMKPSGWDKACLDDEDFLASVEAREAGFVVVPGFDRLSRTFNSLTMPLAEKSPSYHLHAGEAWVFGKWCTLNAGDACLPDCVHKRQSLVLERGRKNKSVHDTVY